MVPKPIIMKQWHCMTFYLENPALAFKKYVSIDSLSSLKSTFGRNNIFDSIKGTFDHQEPELARACEKLGGVPFGKSDVLQIAGFSGVKCNITILEQRWWIRARTEISVWSEYYVFYEIWNNLFKKPSFIAFFSSTTLGSSVIIW